LDDLIGEMDVPGAMFLEMDISMMDASYQETTFDFVWFILQFLGFPPKRSLEGRVWWQWMKPRGRTRQGVRYAAAACNASGRDDTGFMNGLINTCVQLFSVLRVLCPGPLEESWTMRRLLEATPEELRRGMALTKILTMGDDSLTRVPAEYRHKVGDVERFFGEAGFKTTGCTRERMRECVFLGCRPWPSSEGPRWGPTLGRRAFKLFWQRLPDREPYVRAHQIAEATYRAYMHVPILRAMAYSVYCLTSSFAKRAARLPPPVELKRWDLQRARREPAQANIDGLLMAAEIYGCEVQDLRRLEAKYEAVETLPWIVDDPVVDNFLLLDDM